MDQLVIKAIYEIEDYEEECDALRLYSLELVEGTDEYDKCYRALHLALCGELLIKDIPAASENVINAIKRVQLRCAINLMLRQTSSRVSQYANNPSNVWSRACALTVSSTGSKSLSPWNHRK